jgi:non-heme chloroperoxidase
MNLLISPPKWMSVFLALSLIGIVILIPLQVLAQTPPSNFKVHTIRTPDGISVSAQEWGNPAGPEIVFIHGFSQSHLSWAKQTQSDLAKIFRIVTYDLRGHGGSDKPLEPACYRESKRWADEVQAVIDYFQLKKPVLCGWSYGGRVICDYLMYYPQDKLSGINFVGAATKGGPNVYGPAVAYTAKMGSEDLTTNIEATSSFLQACTAKPLPQKEFELMLAFNMICPAKVRANMGGRPSDYEKVLSQLTIPTLVTQGKQDAVVAMAMSEYTTGIIKGARASYYEGAGHCTFWEDAARFNAELAEFVNRTSGR